MTAMRLILARTRRPLCICASLLVMPLLGVQVGAQESSAGHSGGQLFAGVGAQAPDFDRSVFEVGYKWPRSTGAARFAMNLRFGRYSALDLLGPERAATDGVTVGARPLYASIFYGLQSPAPLLQSIPGAYLRASVGITTYLGQSAVAGSDPGSPQAVPEIGPRFAPGVELVLGIGQPRGAVRPWTEIRLGGEYLSRSGLGFVGPVIAVGIDLPSP